LWYLQAYAYNVLSQLNSSGFGSLKGFGLRRIFGLGRGFALVGPGMGSGFGFG